MNMLKSYMARLSRIVPVKIETASSLAEVTECVLEDRRQRFTERRYRGAAVSHLQLGICNTYYFLTSPHRIALFG